MLNWRERITVNPAICHGRACVRGTRVTVSALIDNLAAGIGHEEILKSYPSITDSDLDAVLAYAEQFRPAV